jgi:hypothetical protein
MQITFSLTHREQKTLRMKNRKHAWISSYLTRRLVVQCVFILLIALLLPFSLDEYNHDSGSLEIAQSHMAISLDLLSEARAESEQFELPRTHLISQDSDRAPTRRFVVTRTTSSDI